MAFSYEFLDEGFFDACVASYMVTLLAENILQEKDKAKVDKQTLAETDSRTWSPLHIHVIIITVGRLIPKKSTS